MYRLIFYTNVEICWFEHSEKDAIGLLQDATESLAEAKIYATDAQKVSFEYQTALTKITKVPKLNLKSYNFSAKKD